MIDAEDRTEAARVYPLQEGTQHLVADWFVVLVNKRVGVAALAKTAQALAVEGYDPANALLSPLVLELKRGIAVNLVQPLPKSFESDRFASLVRTVKHVQTVLGAGKVKRDIAETAKRF